MEINPDEFTHASLYKILIGSVVPRPIGWISTVDEAGRPNLAPFSFFNVVCSEPPHVMFSSGIRGADLGRKDTLNNVRTTGEFVVNIVTESLAEAMNLTATELPADVNEFEYAGLEAVPSQVVRPPRVAQSPVHFECQVTHILDISDQPGGSSVVIGRVIHIHVNDALLVDGDKIDIRRLQPIGRLAGTSYSRVNDIFDMVRRPSQIKSE